MIDLDVSSVTDMRHMFSGAPPFNGDLSGWDLSSVVKMHHMLTAANAFNQNLGKWFIVLSNDQIGSNLSTVVGAISAKHSIPNSQVLNYALVEGPHSDLFRIVNNELHISSADPGTYTITITVAHDFLYGSNNSLAVDTTVR